MQDEKYSKLQLLNSAFFLFLLSPSLRLVFYEKGFKNKIYKLRDSNLSA